MKPRFKKVYIEITNRCNLQCDFCAAPRRGPRVMDVDDFRKITDRIKPYTGYIYLHVLGEPLLHPRLDVLLDIAGAAGLKVNLTTNGVLLGSWGAKIIQKPALRQINISLHSQGGARHQAGMNEYIDRMLHFTEEASAKSGVIVSLRLWNLEAPESIGIPFNRMVLDKVSQVFHADRLSLSEMSGKEGIRLRERVYLNTDNPFEWPDLSGPVVRAHGFCHGLRDQVAVLADGTVVPCCLDAQGTISLGNILRDDFKAILESEKVRAIIDGFSRRIAVEALCRHCTYKSRFDPGSLDYS